MLEKENKCMSAELETRMIDIIMDGPAEVEQLNQNTFVSAM